MDMHNTSTGPLPPPRRPLSQRTMPVWAAITCASVALVTGVGIGTASKKNDATATAVTGSAVSRPSTLPAAPTTVAAESAPAPAPIATVAPPPPEPPKPVVVFTSSGSGIKTTQTFTTGSEWSVTYTFDCAGFGGSGNFILEVDKGGDLLANALAAHGSDTSYEHDSPGSHYLKVNSECSWTLKVTSSQ